MGDHDDDSKEDSNVNTPKLLTSPSLQEAADIMRNDSNKEGDDKPIMHPVEEQTVTMMTLANDTSIEIAADDDVGPDASLLSPETEAKWLRLIDLIVQATRCCAALTTVPAPAKEPFRHFYSSRRLLRRLISVVVKYWPGSSSESSSDNKLIRFRQIAVVQQYSALLLLLGLNYSETEEEETGSWRLRRGVEGAASLPSIHRPKELTLLVGKSLNALGRWATNKGLYKDGFSYLRQAQVGAEY